MLRSITTLLFVVCGTEVLAQTAPALSFDTAAFRTELTDHFRKLKLPGLSTAVVLDGEVVFRYTEGFSDIEKRTPVHANSIFPVASLTKTFTAVILMKYAEEGKISLDDYLLDYPYTRIGWSVTSITPDVRLKHVLSHTSEGIPGSHFLYSGQRFNFLYGVFEKVSGQMTLPKAYPQELQKNILGPLQLKSTLSGFPASRNEALFPRIVTPYRYSREKGFVADSAAFNDNDSYPSSGILTSIDDLVTYTNSLDNHSLISATSYAKMTRPYRNNKGLAMPYALGWFSEEFEGTQLHWAYGYGDSYSSLLVRVPERKLTFILLCNSSIPSAALRLGHGGLLQSPFAISFVKYFLNGSVQSRELIARALITRFAETEFGVKAGRSKALLLSLYEKHPELFSQYNSALIYLISDLQDKELDGPMQEAIEAYKRSGHFHPEVLHDIVRFYRGTGREAKTVEFYHLLADSEGFGERNFVIEACVNLGNYYLAQGRREEGRKYLWKGIIYARLAGYDNKYIEERIREMNSGERLNEDG